MSYRIWNVSREPNMVIFETETLFEATEIVDGLVHGEARYTIEFVEDEKTSDREVAREH